ncbi:MAG: cache domain-containing protein, partial [Thiolinea sp.]
MLKSLSTTRRNTVALLVLSLIVVFGLCLIVNAQLAQRYLQQQVASQTERMAVYRNALAAVLQRYEYLPAVLSQNDQLFELAFKQPEQASRQLALIRDESRADEVYILRPDGMTIAASNWDQSVSFVGKNYGFRPYFIDALNTEPGRGYFYGIGATTLIPGYFVSTRYPLHGEAKAVIVVKVDLAKIEKSWRSGGESVFVSDRNGVVILSSKQEWRYKTLQPLTAEQKRRIDAQQQFADEALDSLNIPMADDQHRVHLGNTEYVHTLDSSTVNGWKIHYLTPHAAVVSQLYA